MSQATICPRLLCVWDPVDPTEFERRYIQPVQQHLIECQNLGIRVMMSSAVLELINERCPWNWYGDAAWRGWIIDWVNAVWTELDKCSVGHVPERIPGVLGDCALHADEELWSRWCAFLQWWRTGDTYSGVYLKGLAVQECAVTCNSAAACRLFHLVPPIAWRQLKYPWLLRYDTNLPVDGKFPFVPPYDWRGAQLHGCKHGFLDRDGNEWCWDQLHQNHWDVQLRSGGYQNVSPDGRIL
jgi:hypothetical protein